MRLLFFALPGLFATAAAWFLTPFARRLALRLGAVDQPAARKVHRDPTPRLGGVAVVAASLSVFVVALAFSPWIRADWLWVGIGVGLLPIFCVSFADDVGRLSALTKGLAHVAGASLAVACGVVLNPEVHLFGQTLHIGYLAGPLSVLWLVGVTNAFNLVDGLDGLSAGLALISAGSLVGVFVLVHQTGIAVAVSILAGAILGFLPYNLYPAKIFLGDTGATAIGFILGCLTLRGGSTMTAGFATLLPVIILGLPVADTLLSMLRRAVARWSEREANGVFEADRSHIHHRLLDRLGHQRAVLALYGVGLALALTGLFSITLNVQEAGLLLMSLLVAGFVGIGRLGYQEFGVIRSGFVLRFYDAPVLKRSLFVVFLDLLFVAAATYAAVGLKYDDWSLLANRRLAISMAATLGPINVLAMWGMGVYRGTWRLASVHDATRICIAVAAAAVAAFLVIRPLTHQNPPLSLFFVFALVKLGIANGSRMSYRILAATRSRANAAGERVLIYGAGVGGSSALREILNNPDVGMRPVGFIDDNPVRASRSVNGFPIVCTVDNLEEWIRTTGAAVVIVSTKKIPAERIDLARAACERAGARLLRMDIRFDECHLAADTPITPARGIPAIVPLRDGDLTDAAIG